MNKKSNKKFLVVFGSKSDSNIFLPITKQLEKFNIDYDLRIASAHRTPGLLKTAMERHQFDMVIAGAGLAAHLPGVVASKTIAPVIGVPCDGNFNGLDAFLAIVQMPGGMPVLSVGVGVNPLETDFLLRDFDSVKISGDIKNKRAEKCVETLENFGIEFNEKNPLEIHFFDLKNGKPKKDAVNVPLCDGEKAEDALTFFEKSKTGFFVGLNRGDNAAIFAVSMINRLPLAEYREDMIKKVEADDKEMRHLSK